MLLHSKQKAFGLLRLRVMPFASQAETEFSILCDDSFQTSAGFNILDRNSRSWSNMKHFVQAGGGGSFFQAEIRSLFLVRWTRVTFHRFLIFSIQNLTHATRLEYGGLEMALSNTGKAIRMHVKFSLELI